MFYASLCVLTLYIFQPDAHTFFFLYKSRCTFTCNVTLHLMFQVSNVCVQVPMWSYYTVLVLLGWYTSGIGYLVSCHDGEHLNIFIENISLCSPHTASHCAGSSTLQCKLKAAVQPAQNSAGIYQLQAQPARNNLACRPLH